MMAKMYLLFTEKIVKNSTRDYGWPANALTCNHTRFWSMKSITIHFDTPTSYHLNYYTVTPLMMIMIILIKTQRTYIHF